MKWLVVHHVTALADGGADDPENCITLCGGCHAEWHAIEGPQADFDGFLCSIPAAFMHIMMEMIERNELHETTAKEINDTWTLILWARIDYNVRSKFGRRQLTPEELATDERLAITARRYQKT
jgi:hypothetical protein